MEFHDLLKAARKDPVGTDCLRLRLEYAAGLLESILESGDGYSFSTAFIVISSDEEYAVMDALGLKPIMQSLGNTMSVNSISSNAQGRGERPLNCTST